jgi:hypothetical protein
MVENINQVRSFSQTARETVRGWLLWALVAYLLGVITGAGYFTVGGVFALLSDLASVFMGLTMIPVVLGLERIFQPTNPRLNRNTRLVGLTGFSLLTTGGLILVLFYFFNSLPGAVGLGAQFAGVFLQGTWLILIGLLIFRTQVSLGR